MRRSSCAIIERQGGIVAILKRKHGHANGDETAEEALRREIREELGVEIVAAFPVCEFDVKVLGSQAWRARRASRA